MSDLKAQDVTLAEIDALTAVHADVTIEEVEAFIDQLPNEYRFLAIFVYVTAAPPEFAINLEVALVNKLIAGLGHFLAIQLISRVPSHPDLELLVPVYIRGRRAELLKRKGIPANDEPPQVYLDRNARPFTLEKVDRAFIRLSKKLGLSTPITLVTIADAVIARSLFTISKELLGLEASLLRQRPWS